MMVKIAALRGENPIIIPQSHPLDRFGQVGLGEVSVDLSGLTVLVIHELLDGGKKAAPTEGGHDALFLRLSKA
jgi:hypothetical protein